MKAIYKYYKSQAEEKIDYPRINEEYCGTKSMKYCAKEVKMASKGKKIERRGKGKFPYCCQQFWMRPDY